MSHRSLMKSLSHRVNHHGDSPKRSAPYTNRARYCEATCCQFANIQWFWLGEEMLVSSSHVLAHTHASSKQSCFARFLHRHLVMAQKLPLAPLSFLISLARSSWFCTLQLILDQKPPRGKKNAEVHKARDKAAWQVKSYFSKSCRE